ncbi:MAG: hypothetical protein JST67_05045 [Bacteroidetes bacterium]|nr:hypothetical protein [Bacteroidota bacterium]
MLQQNIRIAKKIYQNKKRILLLSFIGFLVGLSVSFVIKPVYVSSAAVYPSSLPPYSEESQTEQLLQFFESSEIQQYVQKKYHLYRHYKIDTLKKEYAEQYETIFKDKIKITRTKYESIEITAKDYSPDTAKLLVNGVIEAVNWLIDREHKKKYAEVANNAKIYLNYKKHESDSAVHILDSLYEKERGMNIGLQLKEELKNQYRMLPGSINSLSELISMSEEIKKAKSGNKTDELSKLFASMNIYGLETNRLNVYIDDQIRAFASANNEYQKNLKNYHEKTTYTVLASAPVTPTSPIWPKKWMVSLLCAAAVFLLACVYFTFIDDIKQTYAEIISE